MYPPPFKYNHILAHIYCLSINFYLYPFYTLVYVLFSAELPSYARTYRNIFFMVWYLSVWRDARYFCALIPVAQPLMYCRGLWSYIIKKGQRFSPATYKSSCIWLYRLIVLPICVKGIAGKSSVCGTGAYFPSWQHPLQGQSRHSLKVRFERPPSQTVSDKGIPFQTSFLPPGNRLNPSSGFNCTIKTTRKLVVCTAPKRGHYRNSPCKGHRIIVSHHTHCHP